MEKTATKSSKSKADTLKKKILRKTDLKTKREGGRKVENERQKTQVKLLGTEVKSM